MRQTGQIPGRRWVDDASVKADHFPDHKLRGSRPLRNGWATLIEIPGAQPEPRHIRLQGDLRLPEGGFSI